MSDDKEMPPMKGRLPVANFALNTLFKEEIDTNGDTILICQCAKCTHALTTKRCIINKDRNANLQNTVFQHFWSIGMVDFSYEGKCYIDAKKEWSPEKGWYSGEQQEKVDPAKSQEKSGEGSKPSVGSGSGKEVVKSTKVTVSKSYASVLETAAAEEEKEEAGPSTVPVAAAEEVVVQSTPEVYFSPILTTSTSIEGKPETEVSYIPAIIVFDGNTRVVSPGDTLPKEYISVKTPFDEKKNLYFSPVIVFNGDLKQVIRFQPRIFMEGEGTYKYCM